MSIPTNGVVSRDAMAAWLRPTNILSYHLCRTTPPLELQNLMGQERSPYRRKPYLTVQTSRRAIHDIKVVKIITKEKIVENSLPSGWSYPKGLWISQIPPRWQFIPVWQVCEEERRYLSETFKSSDEVGHTWLYSWSLRALLFFTLNLGVWQKNIHEGEATWLFHFSVNRWAITALDTKIIRMMISLPAMTKMCYKEETLISYKEGWNF